MMQVLTDLELDAVSGGAARARFNIEDFLATGPNNAEINADRLNVVTVTTDGLAPSNLAFVTGTLTAFAD